MLSETSARPLYSPISTTMTSTGSTVIIIGYSSCCLKDEEWTLGRKKPQECKLSWNVSSFARNARQMMSNQNNFTSIEWLGQ